MSAPLRRMPFDSEAGRLLQGGNRTPIGTEAAFGKNQSADGQHRSRRRGKAVVVEKLAGTDRRSVGRADEVAEETAADQALFDEVFEAIFFDDPVIRMRASDAVEKASRRRPERLFPHKNALLGELAEIGQQEVRWHLAQMMPRLPLDPTEKKRAAAIMQAYLEDKSVLVRVNALEALMALARGDGDLEAKALQLLVDALENGAPAEKARARKLLRAYEGRPRTRQPR